MTLVVTILAICLVLALAAGVIETCIASWMIRRYKGIKANESSNKSAVENAERRHQAAVEALDDANRVHKGICEKTVTSLLMPAFSTLLCHKPNLVKASVLSLHLVKISPKAIPKSYACLSFEKRINNNSARCF